MEQVPTYLIIGSGRLARHLSFYLNSKNINCRTWSRELDIDLATVLEGCTHVLIAITDNAIEEFVKSNECLKDKVLVHFSGANSIKGVLAFHPLMTFTNDLYKKEFYETISFINFNEKITFQDVFPALSNPSPIVKKELMPYYHSLCVMGGNFTTLLWAKCLESFSEIGIGAESIRPYMEKVFDNTLSDPVKNLTGPLKRKDTQTINKNLSSIEDPNFKNLYQSFVEVGQSMEL